MGVAEPRVLLGSVPALPTHVGADTIRGLRTPDGELGCAEGVDLAIQWIGSARYPLAEALALAEDDAHDVDWARLALGIDGYGDGDEDSYGEPSRRGGGWGHVCGDDYGDGDDCRDGYGYGDALGGGHGYAYNDGIIAEYGSPGRDKSGCGYGCGGAYGDSDGDGDGEGLGA